MRIAIPGAVAALAAGVYFLGFYEAPSDNVRRPVPPATASATATAPEALQDPLNPERPVALDATRSANGASWVAARPQFQYSRSAAERGGVEPCATQQVDSSGFQNWVPLTQGRFSAPRDLGLDELGQFNLVIHLNGDEPVRRELIRSKQAFVLFTLTLPPSQSYAQAFSSSHTYAGIVAGIEQRLSAQSGKTLRVGHVALSAWSAGFAGVAAALSQTATRDVAAVILIDGLHAPRGNRDAFAAQLQPFVDYAGRAAKGGRFMFISHSSIDPPSFASTTETAHHLIASLGGEPRAVRRADAMGLELVEYFSQGGLHVRGYAGNDKADHCAQLALLRDAFAALGRRWAAASPL